MGPCWIPSVLSPVTIPHSCSSRKSGEGWSHSDTPSPLWFLPSELVARRVRASLTGLYYAERFEVESRSYIIIIIIIVDMYISHLTVSVCFLILCPQVWLNGGDENKLMELPPYKTSKLFWEVSSWIGWLNQSLKLYVRNSFELIKNSNYHYDYGLRSTSRKELISQI